MHIGHAGTQAGEQRDPGREAGIRTLLGGDEDSPNNFRLVIRTPNRRLDVPRHGTISTNSHCLEAIRKLRQDNGSIRRNRLFPEGTPYGPGA